MNHPHAYIEKVHIFQSAPLPTSKRLYTQYQYFKEGNGGRFAISANIRIDKCINKRL